MSEIIPFPHRPRLPEDARPIGRQCHIYIEPDGRSDGWTVWEQDEDGGACLGSGLSKREAIRIGLEWVGRCNAELTLSNSNSYYDSSGEAS